MKAPSGLAWPLQCPVQEVRVELGLLSGLVVAALVGTPHCVGMCGGLSVAVGGSGVEQVAWNGGRVLTYAILGALAGAFGHALPSPAWATAVGSVLLVVFALALAGVLPEPSIRWPGLARASAWLAGRRGIGPRFGFGMTAGLLPCGLLYTALAVPVALADPMWGALSMAVFGVATVPALAMAAFGLRRAVARRLWARRLLAVGVLVAGLGSIGMRGMAAPAEDGTPACHAE